MHHYSDSVDDKTKSCIDKVNCWESAPVRVDLNTGFPNSKSGI